MSKTTIRNKKINLLIAVIMACIALFFLFINERYIKTKDDVIYMFLLTVFVTILATSFTSIIGGFFGNSIDDIAESNFHALKSCHEYGLYGIYPNTFPLDIQEIKKDFINSKKLYIVMNDAKGFISNNLELFYERIKNGKHLTSFILQDYDQKDIMSALTRKNGHDKNPSYYANKIKEVIDYHINQQLIKDREKSHKLDVYLNTNYNTLAIVLLDNFAMISIYRVSSGKSAVPHFVFKKGDYEYECIKEDVYKLLEVSKKLIDSDRNDIQPMNSTDE